MKFKHLIKKKIIKMILNSKRAANLCEEVVYQSPQLLSQVVYSLVCEGSPWMRDLILKHKEYAASFVRHMAITGQATDECINQDVLPVVVGYYSPIPELRDLEGRNIWEKRSVLAGINFDIEEQEDLIASLGRKFGSECNWPPNSTGDPYQFYTENNSFSFGCAASLHTMVREFKPRNIIEIGSGNSSLIISDAISLNRHEHNNYQCNYQIIDPYPRQMIEDGLPNLSNLIKKRVELTDPNYFNILGENDILFIDSGHTVKIGGDVNFLYLDILPLLALGVIIHIHDIPLPYDYSRIYFTNPTFRVFWTEAYLLQAFLSLNPDYEVLLSMNMIQREKAGTFQQAFPYYNPIVHKLTSSSFWIKRAAVQSQVHRKTVISL